MIPAGGVVRVVATVARLVDGLPSYARQCVREDMGGRGVQLRVSRNELGELLVSLPLEVVCNEQDPPVHLLGSGARP